MSTIGLEVFEKPINFENILNVRNQLIFKNYNNFNELFSDNCLNDDLFLNYRQIYIKFNIRIEKFNYFSLYSKDYLG